MPTLNFETDRERERWLDEIVALPEGALPAQGQC